MERLLLDYLVEKSHIVFWFFTFPLAGLILRRYVPVNMITRLLIIAAVMLIPLLFHYRYALSTFNEFLIYVMLALASARFINPDRWKYAVAYAVLLLLPLVVITAFASFTGSVKIERRWYVDGYKIECLNVQGFAGKPAMKYRLYKYAMVPVFVRNLGMGYGGEDATCLVPFSESNLVFNTCTSQVTPSVAAPSATE